MKGTRFQDTGEALGKQLRSMGWEDSFPNTAVSAFQVPSVNSNIKCLGLENVTLVRWLSLCDRNCGVRSTQAKDVLSLFPKQCHEFAFVPSMEGGTSQGSKESWTWSQHCPCKMCRTQGVSLIVYCQDPEAVT